MPTPISSSLHASRRSFISVAGSAAVTTLAGAAAAEEPGASGSSAAPATDKPPAVHAGGSEIRLALIGCGGRGAGAVSDALGVTSAPLKLHAMADIFPASIENRRKALEAQYKEKIDVGPDRQFIGFEAYKQAMDALRPGDIAILASPSGFRVPHFRYAIEKGLHVFMEKPIGVDGPSAQRIMELAPLADSKNLKVGCGLMCRHNSARQELFKQLRDGAAGEIITLRGYRMHPAVQGWDLFPGPPEGMSELQYQAKRFHCFLWAGGGIYSDYYVHHIDEACWMKDAWPIKAEATGGRMFRGKIDDQNFDSYAVEYTFADGTKFFYAGRTIPNCESKFGIFGHGTKGAFRISGSGHHPAKSAIFKGQEINDADVAWRAKEPETNPYRQEWIDLVDAIVNDKPYNEAIRGAMASVATALGRFAAHTGRAVTFEEVLNCPDDLTAGVDALTDSSPALLLADKDGRYPVPYPGRFKYEFRD
jgi:predicted dehydrogenase